MTKILNMYSVFALLMIRRTRGRCNITKKSFVWCKEQLVRVENSLPPSFPPPSPKIFLYSVGFEKINIFGRARVCSSLLFCLFLSIEGCRDSNTECCAAVASGQICQKKLKLLLGASAHRTNVQISNTCILLRMCFCFYCRTFALQ